MIMMIILKIIFICFICISFIEANQYFPLRPIYPLKTYKDIRIFHYFIPHEAKKAKWDIWLNIASNCDQYDIVYQLRWKGLPWININNSSLPDNILIEPQMKQLRLNSDNNKISFIVNNPLPGEWYGLSYIKSFSSIKPPSLASSLSLSPSKFIAQALLFKKCYINLGSKVILSSLDEEPFVITRKNITYTVNKPRLFKFYLSSRINDNSIKILLYSCILSSSLKSDNNNSSSSSSNNNNNNNNNTNYNNNITSCPIDIYFRKIGLPSQDIYDQYINCDHIYSKYNHCKINEPFARNEWNYVLIVSKLENIDIQFKSSLIINTNCKGNKFNPLIYNNHTIISSNIATNFSSSLPSSLSSFIHHSNDLCPYLIHLSRFNYQGLLNFNYRPSNILTQNDDNSNFIDIPISKIISSNNKTHITLFNFEIVPNYDAGGIITISLSLNPYLNTTYHNISVIACIEHLHFNGSCLAQIKVNTSDHLKQSLDIIYPSSGIWYLSLVSECYFIDRKSKHHTPVNCEFNTTSINLNIKSRTCNEERCNQHGTCYDFNMDDTKLGFCNCKSGWKGFWCEDDSDAINESKGLIYFLLLTLSNILFIPAVILSLYRRLFIQSLIYFFSMFSSVLYHSCTSEMAETICLIKLNSLQFANFYTELLAFWITLISLAKVSNCARHFLYTLGSIILCFVVEYNRSSVLAFLIPFCPGILIMLISWCINCTRERTCYPSCQLWLFSILPGFGLTITGLVIYAFFETTENYPVIHSLWHSLLGLSFLFLVPSMESKIKVKEQDDLRGKGINHETYYELIAEEGSHLARHPLP